MRRVKLLSRRRSRLVQPFGEPRPRALLGEQPREEKQVLLLEPALVALAGLDVAADVTQHGADAMVVHAQVLGELDECRDGLGTVVERRPE